MLQFDNYDKQTAKSTNTFRLLFCPLRNGYLVGQFYYFMQKYCTSEYCHLRRHRLIQTGAGHPDWKCPVCGATYDSAEKAPERMNGHDKQRFIDQWWRRLRGTYP